LRSLDYDEYDRLSSAGALVPVFREVPGDLKTPVSAFQSVGARASRAFLLESVLGGERLARYSFLGRDPEATVEVRGGLTQVVDAAGQRLVEDGLFAELRRWVGRPVADVPGLPRFTGGAVGYLTYDAVRLFERIPDRHGVESAALASFAFYRTLVAFDHVRQRLILISLAPPAERSA